LETTQNGTAQVEMLTGDKEKWFRKMHKGTDGSDEWKKIQRFTEMHTYKLFRLAHKDTHGSDKCTKIQMVQMNGKRYKGLQKCIYTNCSG